MRSHTTLIKHKKRNASGCRVLLLLFQRHLRNDRLRGSSAAERVAVVRPQWKVDGHFDVRVVYCISIRYFEQTVRRQNENQPKLIHKAFHDLLVGLRSDPAQEVAEVEVCRNFAVIARRDSSAGSFPAVRYSPGLG